MKKLVLFTLFLPLLFFFKSQDTLSTTTGKVSFASLAEDHANIKAVSQTATCLVNKKTGEIDLTVVINDFKFAEEGLHEIFSKQVMKSEKYPTASFKGMIVDPSGIEFSKNGDYRGDVKGALTLHGVTKNMQTKCALKVYDNTVRAMAEFQLSMKDFNIENPIDNDHIKIAIDCLLKGN